MAGLKVKSGDTVEMLSGKDKGKRGLVLSVDPQKGRVVVEGLNLVKKHAKPRPVKGSRGAQMEPGGIIEMPRAVDASTVAVVCPTSGKVGRIGYRFLEDGRKVRVHKASGLEVDK